MVIKMYAIFFCCIYFKSNGLCIETNMNRRGQLRANDFDVVA